MLAELEKSLAVLDGFLKKNDYGLGAGKGILLSPSVKNLLQHHGLKVIDGAPELVAARDQLNSLIQALRVMDTVQKVGDELELLKVLSSEDVPTNVKEALHVWKRCQGIK
jgi:hypothetical protein